MLNSSSLKSRRYPTLKDVERPCKKPQPREVSENSSRLLSRSPKPPPDSKEQQETFYPALETKRGEFENISSFGIDPK